MKIGLKLYPDSLKFIDNYRKYFDFFELFVTPDFDLRKIRKYQGDSILTIHAAHARFGFDMGNPKKRGSNLEIIGKATEAADLSGAKWIILHPGHDFGKGSKKTMIGFIDENYDRRFIFENCISIDYTEGMKKYLFSTPSEMKYLLKRFNARMVLDFNHAICTANVLGKSPLRIIGSFINLNPRCYHIAGIGMEAKTDSHRHLFEVKADYCYLRKIPKSSFITLETGNPQKTSLSDYLREISILRSF